MIATREMLSPSAVSEAKGVRIDHVVHCPALRCTECRVGLDVGSDHRPVIAARCRAGRPD